MTPRTHRRILELAAEIVGAIAVGVLVYRWLTW